MPLHRFCGALPGKPEYGQTVTELGRMGSRELQDLGINRGEI
ncbi:DUF1127 domain-containing protein [Agrobacterium rubi]|nr:DUF1127 domain-containing protein [Agrobacterium rubi]NTF23102.1 DUF1127 domain-containing protein [Agrobacterium rubi]NTF30033.1 DUF1127 domain-containing protein [Agrobacterium rubi]